MVRLFKVPPPQNLKTAEITLESEFKQGGHMQPLYSVDISPGKSLILSCGADFQAIIFDVKTKRCIKKMTFADKEGKDARGKLN